MATSTAAWWALAQARRPPASPRRPFRLGGVTVGSVAVDVLPVLADVVRRPAPGVEWRVDGDGVALDPASAGVALPSAAVD
ncbi:MAG: hypothetical protein ABIX12_05885, partial [Rubrivivax sp.]